MKEKGPIRVLEVQVSVSCLMPSMRHYSKTIIAEGVNLSELSCAAKANDDKMRQRRLFNGAHLGTIIEHEDFPATRGDVNLYRESDFESVMTDVEKIRNSRVL